MTRTTGWGLLGLGLVLGVAGEADARHRCRPPFDQGYGCYFAAPYVGTGRYCAGFGYVDYGYGPGWGGPPVVSGTSSGPVSGVSRGTNLFPATNAAPGMAAPAPLPPLSGSLATPPTPTAPPVTPAPTPDPAAPPAPAK